MEFDLVIKNVWVEKPELRRVDIGITRGLITSIQDEIRVKGNQEINGTGSLASPAFIDAHTHLDKAFLKPEENISGRLDEAIRIMKDNKQAILTEDFEERVEKGLRWSLKNGTMTVRTHVDVTPSTGTESIARMIRIKERWRNLIDIQIVAFPQDGLIHQPGVVQYLKDSLRLGADLIGGIPAIEETETQQKKHIKTIFEIAKEFNVGIDMHIDESDRISDRTLEMLADATLDAGWQGRVYAAHCCALAAYDDTYANHVMEKVKEADIHIISNASVNLVMQGRDDFQPKRRGITRVKELIEKEINVTCGNDNLRDVFYPFGQADMLEAAFVMALAAQMTGREEIETVLNMPRQAAAKALGLDGYGVQIGNPANIVILDAINPVDILSSRSPERLVMRQGNIVSDTRVTTSFTF